MVFCFANRNVASAGLSFVSGIQSGSRSCWHHHSGDVATAKFL